MTITKDEYDEMCAYLVNCASGMAISPSRMAVCQWFVEQVSEGAIRVEPE